MGSPRYNRFDFSHFIYKMQNLKDECCGLSAKLEEERKQVGYLERENTRLYVEIDSLQLPDVDNAESEQSQQEMNILVRFPCQQ